MSNDHVASEASELLGRGDTETDFEPIGEDGDSGTEGANPELDEGEAPSGDYTGGESTSSDGTSTASGQDIQSTGDGVEDSGTTVETVSAQQFDEAMQTVDSKIDALNASTVVLVFALFVCAGILSVSTLVRSMEWR